jgi:hypothetical protein
MFPFRTLKIFGSFLLLCWSLLPARAATEPPALPQNPPLPPSPIQQFREWLSMNAPERNQAVAEWPEQKRKVLLAKLEAYAALPPEERERRLRMLELRWYLRPLMAVPASERKPSLLLVPPYLRELVTQRLHHWDSLDATARKEILANEDARELVTKYYLQLQRGRTREEILSALPPQRRAEVDAAVARWNSLSPAARSRSGAQLTAFFQLPKAEQSRAIEQFTDAERQDIERTLQTFARLSPAQRRLCIESFQKFTMMPPPQRASFLRNAARWEAMSPEERAAWKKLVTQLPPLPVIASPALPPQPDAALPKSKVAQNYGNQ